MKKRLSRSVALASALFGVVGFAGIVSENALLSEFSLAPRAFGAEGDVVVADFDGDDYAGWTVEGEAFGTAPARGTLPGQMNVSGFDGPGLVNSFVGYDATTGTLTSPEVELTQPFVNFLIGGGGLPGTRFELIVDGEVVRTARGPNTNPGGSEELERGSWDVAEFLGKKAIFRIVDAETGGWGHINVDKIFLSAKKWVGIENVREVAVEKRFLMLPIKTGSPMRWVRVEVDGKVEREFTAELLEVPTDGAPVEPTFLATLDARDWLGKTVKFVVEKADEETVYAPIRQSDEPTGGQVCYSEKYRPQFHFSPRRGWTNDPNGLVLYNGRYHLFYQHNPFGVNWGNMTWGHATSPDLLHWTESSDAIEADPLGTIFSGSAAVDRNNSTGFQTDPNGLPPLVCMFTYNGPSMRAGNPASQGLAYSLDDGETFVKYEGNPTIPHMIGANRDPKIFWSDASNRWIVALYLDAEDYALFASDDLKSWTKICDIKNLGCSECPDMFALPVDGDPNNVLWVFWGGNGKYLLGDFDGTTFVRKSEPLNAKWGGNDYAAQTYSDTPGRRIQLSWMSGGQYPDMPFNQQFSVPRELSLRSTPDGVRLNAYPVKELETLRGEQLRLAPVSDGDKTLSFVPAKGESRDYDLLDVELKYEFKSEADVPTKIVAAIRGREFELNFADKTLVYGDVVAPLPFDGKTLELRAVLDRTSLELFAGGGLSQIAKCFVPADENDAPLLRQTFVAPEGKSTTNFDGTIGVWPMKSVWNVDEK